MTLSGNAMFINC